jgi:hypothetical protein
VHKFGGSMPAGLGEENAQTVHKCLVKLLYRFDSFVLFLENASLFL